VLEHHGGTAIFGAEVDSDEALVSWVQLVVLPAPGVPEQQRPLDCLVRALHHVLVPVVVPHA
jgi:hypothetical protein